MGLIVFLLSSVSAYALNSSETSSNSSQMVSLKVEAGETGETPSSTGEETSSETGEIPSSTGEETSSETGEVSVTTGEETSSETGETSVTEVEEVVVTEVEEVVEPEGAEKGTEEGNDGIIKAGRLNMLVAIILLSAFIMYFIFSAQKGTELFIRKIGGLSALDDAVGRATEMGKAVLYIPGIMDMDDIQTLAGLSILSYVAEKTAEYDTPILVPTSRSLVMSTAQEVVKEAYMRAGRPDAFRADNIRYLTDDQFGFVAGVDGIMVRDKPAANFYMGCFYAESLILAETGHATGAIQMAGTAMPSQLPFFVAACDYTLIGEELFAASAYLSREPKQLGSLKGQDMGKLVMLLSIILGCILETAGITAFTKLFETK